MKKLVLLFFAGFTILLGYSHADLTAEQSAELDKALEEYEMKSSRSQVSQTDYTETVPVTPTPTDEDVDAGSVSDDLEESTSSSFEVDYSEE